MGISTVFTFSKTWESCNLWHRNRKCLYKKKKKKLKRENGSGFKRKIGFSPEGQCPTF